MLAGFGLPHTASARTVDIAVYHTSLSRPGPGLLLRDILGGKDTQLDAVISVIHRANPDILLLLDIDYDLGLQALTALRDRIANAGTAYPFVFALPPNSGVATGLDLDRDGRLGGPRDAQAFGEFTGQGGMAILSKHPIRQDAVQTYTDLLWQDLPGALLFLDDDTPLLPPDVRAVQRLSTSGHWVVPVIVAQQDIWLLAFHAGPPVFSSFKDHNARRNHDEARFWETYLSGSFAPPPAARFVVIGGSNMDIHASAGRPEAMRNLLANPRLQDPRPKGFGQSSPSGGHRGDPALNTVRWPPPGPGNLRVDYILPSADWTVVGASVLWPPEDSPFAAIANHASRHALVMVTLALD